MFYTALLISRYQAAQVTALVLNINKNILIS